jgi:hypothetical protein
MLITKQKTLKVPSQSIKLLMARLVAQNAYYHLGESYLNLDKKQEALNAFKNASEMTLMLQFRKMQV